MEQPNTPYFPLMMEHRLIERAVKVIKENIDLMKVKKDVNTAIVELLVDFLSMYADRCHHGKEEEILFRALEKKEMSEEHRKMMDKLIEQHMLARRLTSTIADANERYIKGDKEAFSIILECMENLAKFYPEHIKTEDRDFFGPVMKYFTKEELEEMVKEEYDYDRSFLHLKYDLLVLQTEKLLGK